MFMIFDSFVALLAYGQENNDYVHNFEAEVSKIYSIYYLLRQAI